MITQVKKFGNSTVIVLDPDVLKFKGFKVGDWIDLNEVVKVKKGGEAAEQPQEINEG